MSVQSPRRKGLLAAILLASAALTLTAGPAFADDGDDAARTKSADYCWINSDNGYSHCYVSDEARAAAVLRLTGGPLVEEGSALARTATANSALASFVVARFYDGSGYSGANTAVSAGSSTVCVSNSVQNPTMIAGWNDRVTSYHSYYGCQTRIYEDTNYGGTSQVAVDDSNVGALDNETSSYRVY